MISTNLKYIIISILVFSLNIGLQATEKLSVADVFTNSMVLQRDAKVKIWGNAANNTEIVVEFNHQLKKTKAKDGKWMITLQAMPFGGPYEMEISAGNDQIKLTDILIGDVWLAGGQSNMEFALRRESHASEEIPTANNPNIRYFKAPRKIYPTQEIEKQYWVKCTPETAGEMSAIAYYFARDIQRELNIPIGIIQAPFGGTTAEAWMSRELLVSNPNFKPIVARYDSVINNYRTNEYDSLYADFQNKTEAYNDSIKKGFKKAEKPEEPLGERNFRRPYALYYNMLKPLMPYTLKGIIFYQGESNTARGYQYRTLFPAMISEWRKGFEQGNLPFLFIQLPKFETKTREWEELREAQLLTSKKVKNTGMAVAFDQGNPKNIHPTDKKIVAHRLTQLALGKVYNRKIIYQGPDLKSMKINQNQIILSFNNIGGGLITSDGSLELKGFSICGLDGVFYPAKAIIVNNTVVLSSDSVPNPKNVRYAWANSMDINFFNKDGFPASPFRTDNFQLKSYNVN